MAGWNGFRGRAKKLDDVDLPRLGRAIGVGEDELHAFMEAETRGNAFDAQGRPVILFEPHVFARNLPKDKRALAFKKRLACTSWGQIPYGPSNRQYDRLTEAMKIDETAALKACSVGLFQVLGENHRMVGYDTVQEMWRAFMDDAENHLRAAIAFIKAAGIDDDLRRHDWEKVARVYNGPGYRKNNYHTKMAAAFKKWKRIKDTAWSPEDGEDGQEPSPAPEVPAAKENQPLAKFEVEAIQKRLRELGYFQVGKVDGLMGPSTVGALSALQAVAGIPVTGYPDEATKAALAAVDEKGEPLYKKPISEERANTTVDDLRQQGSKTIKEADKVSGTAKAVGVSSGLAFLVELFSNWFQSAQELIAPAKEAFTRIPAEVWFLLGVGLAVYLWHSARQVKLVRLEAERSGKTAGEPDPAPSPPVKYVEGTPS